MNPTKRLLLGVAMTLATVATAFPQYEGASRSDSYSDRDSERSGYSYVRETVGGVTVQSRFNGRVTARPNMPISAGDEILVSDAGRAEIGLADGNLLFVGGGTRARFSSLYAQQGEDDDFSAIDLRDGSVVLAAMGYDENSIPRIDTEDATVYLSSGSRVRVNADPRRGTVVVVRSGSVEVRTRVDSYTLESGQYLMVEGDEPAEISRGVFSRDRFDLWAADRMEDITVVSARSASVQYVDDDYASDVVALDDYGDWEYSSTYSTNVWIPRVSVGWTPYSYGSWYYTPVGLTWWSYDPWGWYPHHYGSWYFDVGFNHWCWTPAYTYSPAWVYWAYTPRYVGWCPTGYYSFYSPWYDNYYRSWGWNPRYRGGFSFAISGTFRKDQIDFGGWNFVNAGSFGSGFDRVNVIPGTKIAPNLVGDVSISSKPIVVTSRGDSLPLAIQSYVRQAPSLIQRTSGDSSRLAPVLGRQKTLPASTVEELKGRAVVAGRGRLAGPGADQVAPRGVIVDRGGSMKDILGSRGFEKRTERTEKGSVQRGGGFDRGRKAPEPVISRETSREAPVTGGGDVWRGNDRGRGLEKREAPAVQAAPAPSSGDWRGGRGRGLEKREAPAVEAAPRERSIERSAPAPERSAPAPRDDGDWRGRGPSKRDAPPARAPAEAPRQKPSKQFAREGDTAFQGGQDWRRSESPARRVIERAVPGRRWENRESPRVESAPPAEWRQRGNERPQPREYRQAPQAREYREAPQMREYRQAPQPREYRQAPQPREYRQAPQPREYRQAPQAREYREAPQMREYRQAPQPREYRQPPQMSREAPRAPQYSAPAPRSEPRPAPAPRPNGNFKGNGRGHKG